MRLVCCGIIVLCRRCQETALSALDRQPFSFALAYALSDTKLLLGRFYYEILGPIWCNVHVLRCLTCLLTSLVCWSGGRGLRLMDDG